MPLQNHETIFLEGNYNLKNVSYKQEKEEEQKIKLRKLTEMETFLVVVFFLIIFLGLLMFLIWRLYNYKRALEKKKKKKNKEQNWISYLEQTSSGNSSTSRAKLSKSSATRNTKTSTRNVSRSWPT